jgi:Protein of unknown function (DUF2786)
MTEDRRADMLRKIRGLLAKADGTNNEHEADAFRTKAETLMLKYRIEQHELGDASGNDHIPTATDMDFAWYWDSQHGGQLWGMMLDVARHCRVKVVYWKPRYGNQSTIPVVGLPSDVSYFDMLFTGLMLELGKGLEPKPRHDVPMIKNLVALKEAGQQWLRIAEQLRAIDQLSPAQFKTKEELALELHGDAHRTYTVQVEDAQKKMVHHLNFSGKYTKFCKDNDRPRLRTTPKMYQRSFAYGFTQRINERLRAMRREAQTHMTAKESSGMELMLADVMTRANHKAVELYGQPPEVKGSRGRAREVMLSQEGIDNGRAAANRADLGGTKIKPGSAGELNG